MRYGERTRSGTSISGWTKRSAAGNAYGVATGGSSSSITDNSVAYTLLSFTTDGTLTVSKAGLFDVLCVGGGGGSVSTIPYGEASGGGGGGSVLISTLYFAAGTYIADVGAGGAAVNEGRAGDGSPSVLYDTKQANNITMAFGGGGGSGGWYYAAIAVAGNVGGSSYRSGYGAVAAVASTSPLGYSGGNSNGSTFSGGGGGAGGDASGSTAGVGRTTTFTGTSLTLGVGGGGGTSSAHGGTATTANSGNGGNGRQISSNAAGNNGINGAIYVRFRV